MTDKKGYLIYADIKAPIDFLSDEEAGQLFKAILNKINGFEPGELSPRAAMAYAFVSRQIDRDTEKWEEVRNKRSANGKKGGRPKKAEEKPIEEIEEEPAEEKQEETAEVAETETEIEDITVEGTEKANGFLENQTKAKKANGFFEKQKKQTKAKKAVNVNVNENVTVNVKDISPNGDIYIPFSKNQENQKPQKHQHGEFKNVLLTDNEYKRLSERFGNALSEKIEDLSYYLAAHKTNYKSHYRVILNWRRKDDKNNQRAPAGGAAAQNKNQNDGWAALFREASGGE